MSISQNFPTTKPTLNLDFARSKRLDPRITFSRSSTATYVDEDGLIKTARANIPRFNHDASTGESLGLLIEESRTNLMPYSEDFSNWQLYQSSVSTNTVIAPDGTLTADKLQENIATDQHLWFRDIGTVGLGSKYTFSCFFKAAERTKISLTSHAQGYTVFDLSNGTVSASGGHSNETIVAYPNGWYRCSITVTKTDTTGAFYIVGWTTSNVYAGTAGYGVYAWGGQLENADYVSSYIPNLSTGTTTRSADSASITGSNFTNFYNQYEGTLFANFMGMTTRASITYDRYVSFVGSDPNLTDISFYTQTGAGGAAQKKIGVIIRNNSSNEMDTFVSGLGPDFGGKAILAYKSNDAAYTINAITPVTDTSVNVPTVIAFVLCGAAGYQLNSSAHIKQVTYYPVRLTNSQLQELTK